MSGEGRIGRPTKLTPEAHAAIVADVERGNFAETAAQLAGIDRATFFRWMDRGARSAADDPDGAIYRDFRAAVTRARAKAEADAVQEIRNGFADPKTGAERAQWYLERAHNDRWGRREKVTVENAVNAEVDLILARLEAALPPEWFEVALRAITGGGAGRGEAGDADGVPRLPDATDPVH